MIDFCLNIFAWVLVGFTSGVVIYWLWKFTSFIFDDRRIEFTVRWAIAVGLYTVFGPLSVIPVVVIIGLLIALFITELIASTRTNSIMDRPFFDLFKKKTP